MKTIKKWLFNKRFEKRNKKAEAKISLSEAFYTEIIRRPKGYHAGSRSAKMDFEVCREEGYRYFAKRLPDSEYHLIVKNKKGKIVYEVISSDWTWLHGIFQ